MAQAQQPSRATSEKYPLKEERTSIIETLQPRDATSKKDFRLINFIVEDVKMGDRDPNSDDKGKVTRRFGKKRPGLANHSQPPAGAAVGRGLYHWHVTDIIYSVFDTKLYADTSDTGITLSSATGTVFFDETNPTDTTESLLISDGTNLYSITSTHTLTVTSTSSDADFPTGNTGHIVYFDTYAFLATADGNFYNSDVDGGITSWAALGVQATEMFPDPMIAIAKQKDQFIAFGGDGIEFYYNNAASGSPLLRIEQNATQVGLSHKNTLAIKGDTMCWVSSHKDGGYSVWKMDGLKKVFEIGNDFVDKVLKGETIANCWAYMIYEGGGLLYVINCPTYASSIVYDLRNEVWYEWQSAGGSDMSTRYVTQKDNVTYLQDAANGRIYTFSPTTYQDSGSTYSCTVQFAQTDHNSPFRKFSTVFEIIGDNVSSEVIVLAADDDYTTYSTYGNMDMSVNRKIIRGMGSYYQRSWKLLHSSNTTLRIEGIGEQFKEGNK